jgi:hypothetical protein
MVVEYKEGQWKYFSQIAVINLEFIYCTRFLFFYFIQTVTKDWCFSISRANACVLVHVRIRGCAG